MIAVLVSCAIGLGIAGSILWFAWWVTRPLKGLYFGHRDWPANRGRRP
jgi:hypothetical protein